MEPTALTTRSQIERITAGLIESSLCNQQNFPVILDRGAAVRDVAYSGVSNLSLALKDVPYEEIYDAYDSEGAYNFKMVDGALIQMLYRYDGDVLLSHRLAFFPSPYLDQFQNEPEIYETDQLYAEVLNRSLVAFPLRFDFNRSDEIHVDVDHPKSHLTLGEYTNCRIPVCSPVAPSRFINFVLRSFYNTAHRNCHAALPTFEDAFGSCISRNEAKLMHIRLVA